MSSSSTSRSTVQRWLAHYGWRHDTSAAQWALATQHGEAILRQEGRGYGWEQFVLRGGAVPSSSDERALYDNARLYGPVKLVATGEGWSICRADLPWEFPATASRGQSAVGRGQSADGGHRGCLPPPACCLPAGAVQDPHRQWAAAITACAKGEPEAPPPAISASGLAAASWLGVADQIKRHGWSASEDDGQVHVHVQLPGVFREVLIDQRDSGQVLVATDLTELDEFSATSREAAFRLAQAANRRLPLVRFAIEEKARPQVLRAEVHLACALIPGAWLWTALEAVEAAISLTARELQALRDPELAELVLAAPRGLIREKEE